MKRLKRSLSILLTVLMLLSILPMSDVGIEAEAVTYDPDAAIAYAKAHYNDGKGLCAEFVSDCLKAGGFTAVYNVNARQLGRQLQEYGEKITCSGWSSSSCLKASMFNGTLSKGDVIIWENSSNSSSSGHAMLYSGKNNSSGQILVYAHNNPKNEEVIKPSSSAITVYAIHLNSTSTLSCTGYNIAYSTNAENGTFYDANTVTITVTPHINNRDAYDDEITAITVFVKKPDGSVATINFGTNKTNTLYFSGDYDFGTYTYYARVETKYGSFTGAADNGSVSLTLSKTSLTAQYFTTNNTLYTRISFGGLGTYLTESSDYNVVSSKRINDNSQVWKLIKNDDYSYTIVSLKSGKALTVYNGQNIQGSNVTTSALQYSNNQKWNLCIDGEDRYYLRAFKSNSAVLDVNGGYSTDNTNVHLWTFNGTAAQKVDLLKPYIVTYNANGGSGAPSIQYKNYNESISLSSSKPTRSGYEFLGWSTSSSATSASYSAGASYSANADLTLYAVWKNNSTYTLSYNDNGGSGAPSSQTGAKSYTISSTVPTRFGYTFLGWSTSSSATSASYKPGNTISLSNATTLYAVWKTATTMSVGSSYTASIGFANQEVFYSFTPSTSGEYVFESTGSVDSKVEVFNSSGTSLGTDDDSSDEGYNFKLKLNLSAGTKYYIKVRAYNTDTGNISFNVKRTTYALTYSANGGSGAPSSQTGAVSYTISSTVPTRFGYTFLGWSTSSSATNASYKPGNTISLSGATTLYAVWKSATTMSVGSFYTASIGFANQEVYYSFTPSTSGEYVFESTGSVDSKVEVFNSSGTSLGSDDDSSDEGYNFKLKLNLTAGTKYYVKVRVYSGSTGVFSFSLKRTTYTLSYYGNGGSNVPTGLAGATSYTISSTVPTRFGYTFLGWSTSSSATSASYKPGDTITLTENTILYAVWQNNTSSMSVNSSNSVQISTGGEMKYFTFTPTISGTYVIYSTGSDDTKVYLYNAFGAELDSDDDDGDNNNFRLEYNLTAGTKYIFGVRYYNSTKTGTISFKFGKVFTITYNANSGSNAPSAQKKDYGKSVTLSSTTPTRSGYVFKGWATSSSATSATYQSGSTYSTESDVTLYAVWHSHSYSSRVTTAATCTTTGTKTYTCNGCSDSYTTTIPATGHTWTAATCTVAKTCSVCKTTDGAALGHSYTSKVTKAATCTAAGVKTFTCSKCSHSYTESIPATGHTWTAATCTAAKTCSVCKATDGTALGHNYTSTVTKAATCTAAGVKTFTCSKCSNSYTETIPATGHKWTAATCTAAKTCSVCKATEGSALGHNYTSTVTKAATCTTTGTKTYTCNGCSDSYTTTIPATGHTWTAATCTAAKTCSVCKATDGAALGHSYTSKVTKAATCTAAGVKTFTCSKCSNSYTESIPATGHTWTAATCTAAKTCSVCKATDGAALGHSYTSTVTKAATCTTDGVKTFTCSKCSHSYTESIPATGHTWTAATCTAAKTCSVCKATEGSALGHSYTSTVTKAATCTTDGVKTFTCSKCSNSYTESIAATGHNWTAATCTAAKTCSVCKATDGAALGHSYTSKVTKAATCTTDGVKTFTCSKCSHSYTESIPATGHTWTAATCTAAKTCSVCKATEGSALGHNYTSTVTKAATCTAAGVKTFTCSKCSHSYTESIPATGHTWTAATCTAAKTCSVCKATDGTALGHSYTSKVTKAATCTAAGVKTFTCSKCSNSYTETIPATGHKWTAATCTAAKTCSVCKATDGTALGHSYTSKVTKAATCTTDGVKTFTCSKCSHSYTESIAATGHKWTAATCTAAKTCSVCKATDGAALGHNYTSTVTKAATCTAAGVKTFTCSKCSHSYTESIPVTGHTWTAATCTAAKTCSVCKATDGAALGHNYTSTVTKAATCTAAGVKTFTCSKCSNSYTETIPATGHTWTAATCTAAKTCSVCNATDGAALGHSYTSAVTKAATCTAAGVKTFTCSVCKDSYTETIAALGHTPGLAATCTTDQTCTVCGEVLTEKLGHDYNAVVTAPTCTTDGYTTYTCTACGDSYVADTVSATGHSYNGVDTTAPTCTAVGIKTFTCADCGDVYTEEMSALGHTEETLSAVAATCTETGLTEGKQCSVCGEILVEQAEIPANGHVDEDANGSCDHCSAMMPGAELLGDVDGDGQITSSDARSALRAAVGLDSLTEKQQRSADVNMDGQITASDARSVLRASVGLEVLG